ncbi:hypothetical protein N1851_027214 [Merluccius polli]|uniref:Uncharacterized protein n=1 Tax=Merluccius polli TaxID=89951 RepID=A0AA47NSD0_MERPO|nr:hypothetical protein N1851_027214 [Merluccius polli]
MPKPYDSAGVPITVIPDMKLAPDETDKLAVLCNWLTASKDWMVNNFLQLNADKTEVLINASNSIAILFDQHIKLLSCTCFFHLRNIAKLRSVVSKPEQEMIIHAFISSRLESDYCNSLFTYFSKSSLDHLQMYQLLRSSDQGLLVVPQARLKTKVIMPLKWWLRHWNTLPLLIRSAVSVDAFKKQLKTHLFKLAFVLSHAV